jgi:hypothetical protein
MGARAVYFSDAMAQYANLLEERVSILTAATSSSCSIPVII